MRLIFMGTAGFAAVALRALYNTGDEIALVVTQPDRPIGRHRKLEPTRVKAEALDLRLDVCQPEKVSDPDFLKKLKKLKPDLIVVAAYGQILKKDLLGIPRFGCINIHASLLPRWRGAAPIPWAIISGDEYSGVTIIEMSEGLDSGDILLKKSIKLSDDENAESLTKKLSIVGGELAVEAIERLKNGSLKSEKQDDFLASYAPKLYKDMGHMDWKKSAIDLERLIRGLYPWPGTFGYSDGRRIKIIEARVSRSPKGDIMDSFPGRVYIERDRMFVACKDSFLEILRLEPAGKNVMNTADFIRGYSIKAFD